MNPMLDAIARVKEADSKADESRMAFTLGKFDEYLAKQQAEILSRLESEYAGFQNAGGNDSAPNSGAGIGAGGIS